jgi:hypothetical protein
MLGQHHEAEKENHVSLADLIRIISASCTSQGSLSSSHSGDGSVACRGGSTEVASSRAFGKLFEPLYLVRHHFLEKWPHLEPEAKDEGF